MSYFPKGDYGRERLACVFKISFSSFDTLATQKFNLRLMVNLKTIKTVIAEVNILERFKNGNQMHAPAILEGFWTARQDDKSSDKKPEGRTVYRILVKKGVGCITFYRAPLFRL